MYSRLRFLILFSVLLFVPGMVFARPSQEPRFAPLPARGTVAGGDVVTGAGTLTLGKERYVLKFAARRTRKNGKSVFASRSGLFVYKDKKLINHFALPNGITVSPKTDAIATGFLQPGKARCPYLTINGLSLILVFPNGMGAKGYSDSFSADETSLFYDTTTAFAGTDKEGFLTIEHDYHPAKGGDSGTLTTYHWKGTRFVSDGGSDYTTPDPDNPNAG